MQLDQILVCVAPILGVAVVAVVIAKIARAVITGAREQARDARTKVARHAEDLRGRVSSSLPPGTLDDLREALRTDDVGAARRRQLTEAARKELERRMPPAAARAAGPPPLPAAHTDPAVEPTTAAATDAGVHGRATPGHPPSAGPASAAGTPDPVELCEALFGSRNMSSAIEREFDAKWKKHDVSWTGLLVSLDPQSVDPVFARGPLVRAAVHLHQLELGPWGRQRATAVVALPPSQQPSLQGLVGTRVAIRGRLVRCDGFGRRLFVETEPGA